MRGRRRRGVLCLPNVSIKRPVKNKMTQNHQFSDRNSWTRSFRVLS